MTKFRQSNRTPFLITPDVTQIMATTLEDASAYTHTKARQILPVLISRILPARLSSNSTSKSREDDSVGRGQGGESRKHAMPEEDRLACPKYAGGVEKLPCIKPASGQWGIWTNEARVLLNSSCPPGHWASSASGGVCWTKL